MEMVKKFEPLALFLMIIGALNWAIVVPVRHQRDHRGVRHRHGHRRHLRALRRLRPGLGAAADGRAPSRPRAAPARRLTPDHVGGKRGPGPRARPASYYGERRCACSHSEIEPLDRRRRRRRRHHRRRWPTPSPRSGVAEGQASAFVRGSTAAMTTMEFEPGGVHDLRAAARPPDPDARRLRAQPAQPRLQLARPPARLARRRLGDRPDRRRPPGARHLAAARADRLRRPPARADRDLPDRWARSPSRSRTAGAAGAISGSSRASSSRPGRIGLDRLARPAPRPPRGRRSPRFRARPRSRARAFSGAAAAASA